MSESFNLARLKKGPDIFEVVVDPNKAMAWKKNNAGDVRDVLVYPKIFSDAKKGMQASEQKMKQLFETDDPIEVAKIIIKQGQIQLTSEYRQGIVSQKKKRLIDLIHRNGVDPRTNAPHPLTRIEAALDDAKVKIDEFKSADEQLQDVLKKLIVILPIKFVKKELEVIIPANYAAKAYNVLRTFGKVLKEQWNNDGSWTGNIEIPGGLEQEFYDKLNNLTQGEAQAKVTKVV